MRGQRSEARASARWATLFGCMTSRFRRWEATCAFAAGYPGPGVRARDSGPASDLDHGDGGSLESL